MKTWLGTKEKAERKFSLLGYLETLGLSCQGRVLSLGTHSRAYLLSVTGKGPVVVKVLKSEGKWKRYIASNHFLKKNSILVPTLFEDLSVRREKVIAEEFIAGQTLTQVKLDKAAMDSLVNSMLSIHRINSSSWGGLTERKKKKGYFLHTLKKIYKLSSDSPEAKEEIRKYPDLKEIVDKLEQKNNRYQFIHGDLHGENVVINEDGIWFIDLVRAGFGSYVKDLVRIDIWERETFGTHFVRDKYIKAVSDPFLREKLLLFYTEALVRHVVKYKREALEIKEAIASLQDEAF